MELIEKLRISIDDQYAAAIKALDVLARYLAEDKGKHTPSHSSDTNGDGSLRESVLRIIKTRWATVNEISAESGLPVKQIRGVLYAPTLRERIDKQGHGKGDRRY